MKIIGLILIGIAAFAFLSQSSEKSQVDEELAAKLQKRREEQGGGHPTVTQLREQIKDKKI